MLGFVIFKVGVKDPTGSLVCKTALYLLDYASRVYRAFYNHFCLHFICEFHP